MSHLPPETTPGQGPHKYTYAIFDGFAGERYLLSLAQKFAPFALWRTWQAHVSYQAPENICYVGVSRLTDERDGRVGVKERKIYLDLAAMEARGWLRQEHVRLPFKTKEGEIVHHTVPAKYFDGFYDTAYAYHQWMVSPEYLAPVRENVPLILANADLTRRLIRFENYRRLLVCGKPGRKASVQKQDFYTCQLTLLEERGRTDVQEVNQYSNTLTKTDSVYRIPNDDQYSKDGGEFESSTPEREEREAALAIRKSQLNSSSPKPKPDSPPRGEEGGETAKDVIVSLGYTKGEFRTDLNKRGAAAVGIPADQYAILNGNGSGDQSPVEPAVSIRPVREIPQMVEKVVTEFAGLYDDEPLVRSDVTRAAKIYFTAAQTLEHFNDTLFFACFDQARAAALKKNNCVYTNGKGRANRMPYFFTCLENAFSFSLEELVYLRSDDPLYSDYTMWDVTDKVYEEYQRLFNTGQISEDYRTWLCDILDALEKRTEAKPRNNKTTRA